MTASASTMQIQVSFLSLGQNRPHYHLIECSHNIVEQICSFGVKQQSLTQYFDYKIHPVRKRKHGVTL